METAQIKADILEAFGFRHACKRFDSARKIGDDDFGWILETGRLSPSSFGMQGCRYLVITSDDLKAALKPECWNQKQIDSCSHLVVYLTRTRDLAPGSDWVAERFRERGLTEEATAAYMQRYADFHTTPLATDRYQWGARQCYIALGNMMSAAAMIGIDSCPIEGFDKSAVEKILDIDASVEEVAVLCAFGYRVDPAPKKYRLPLASIAEFR